MFDMIRNNTKRFWRNDSGQALAEGVVTLSLLSMTWVLLFYTGFMGSSRVRCAVAARHAAWGAGNGIPTDQIDRDAVSSAIFWTNTDKVKLTSGTHNGVSTGSPNVPGRPSSSGKAGSVMSGVVDAIQKVFPPIHTADVKFGVDNKTEAATAYPFVFMNTRFPFMESTELSGLLSVECHAEWDEVKDNWDSLGTVMKDLIKGIFGF